MDSMAKCKWAELRQKQRDLRLRADFVTVAWNLKYTGIHSRNGNREDVRKRMLRFVMTCSTCRKEDQSVSDSHPTQAKTWMLLV